MDMYTKHQICTKLDDIYRVCEHLSNDGDKLIGFSIRKKLIFNLEEFANKYKEILDMYEEE